jgi:hypothetical protein
LCVLGVDVEGQPSNFREKPDDSSSLMNNYDENTEVGRCSNESMASSASIGNIEILDITDNDDLDGSLNEDDIGPWFRCYLVML